MVTSCGCAIQMGNADAGWAVWGTMRRSERWVRWLLSDLDDDLARVRRGVLGGDAGHHITTTCDDDELRLMKAVAADPTRETRRTVGVAFPPPP